jgi:hypothetical protein
MNPNSHHQLWNRLAIVVTLPYRPSHAPRRFFEGVKGEIARELRRLFGSTGQARVRYAVDPPQPGLRQERWLVDVRYEATDKPVYDPGYRRGIEHQLRAFFVKGFGALADVQIEARVEAGDSQDGRPPQQLLILPPIVDPEMAEEARNGKLHRLRRPS